MANEIQTVYQTGTTIYAVALSPSGQAWNGAAFETLNASNWVTYATPITEQVSAGIYFATMPAGIVAPGTYSVNLYIQAVGSPAVSDSCIGSGNIAWDGSAEISLTRLDTPVSSAVTSANNATAAATAAGTTATAIKSKTDLLPAQPASKSDVHVTILSPH